MRLERVGRTGGRPLGIDGPRRWPCWCATPGAALAMDPGSGAVEELTVLVHGQRMTFCNNAAVGADGTIWFSDSSRLHGIDRWKADMVENTCSGRLLRRSPDGSVSVVLEGLRFANGVALARTSHTWPWPRRPAAPSYAGGWRGSGRARRTARWTTSRPHRTTSPAAATG